MNTTGTIPLTGRVRDAAGNLFNGAIRLVLSYSASHHVTLDDLVIAEEVNFPIQNGGLPANARLVPNDMLTPAKTTYTAQYLNPGGKIVGQNVFYVSGNAFDIGTAIPTPLTTSNISFAVEELQGPPGPPGPMGPAFPLTPGTAVYADTLYLIKDPGSTSSDSRAISMRVVDDQVRHASRFPGSNAGAQIANAIADLPASGGVVDATGLEGTQNVTQNMFASLGNKPLCLKLGACQLHLTVSQMISAQYNIHIQGMSPGGDTASNPNQSTQLVWDGSNGGTALILDRVRDSLFENFGVRAGTGTLGIGIQIDHVSPPSGSFLSANNHFKHVTVGASTTGIQIGNTSTQNNSEHTFEDCHINGSGTYGYFINDAQSKYMKIIRGLISSRTSAVYQNYGSFAAHGILLTNNGVDFSLGSPWDTILIENCDSEGAARFLDTHGGTSGPWAVTLIANRYAPNGIHADGAFIKFANRGIVTLIGNDFADKINVSTANVDLSGGVYGGCRLVSLGNIYASDVPFVSAHYNTQDIVSLGDMAWTVSGTTAIQLPNLFGDGYNASVPANTAIVLSNGANNNIALPGSGFIKIEGPTGAFSISGFTPGNQVGARRIQIFNSTAQQMTIKNLAGSSANNQIQTLTGADVVLRAGTSFATFIYDPYPGLAKWILMNSN
jgi:hypothetical protein